MLFCTAVGWTYEQYLRQPTWFVDLLKMKLVEDAASASKAKT
jgi:hypothetical protein